MNIQGNPVLIVVDFQGGPIDSLPGGGGAAIDAFDIFEQRDKAQAMVAGCRAGGVPVVWIQEVHKSHLQDIGRELDGSEPPHCIEGAATTAIVDGLVPAPEEFHIRKRRYSAFFGTELDIVLRAYKADSVILIGGFTDVCVLYTAIDAHQRDLQVNVVTDVVSASSVTAHNDALDMIKYVQQDALVTSSDVAEWLESRHRMSAAAPH